MRPVPLPQPCESPHKAAAEIRFCTSNAASDIKKQQELAKERKGYSGMRLEVGRSCRDRMLSYKIKGRNKDPSLVIIGSSPPPLVFSISFAISAVTLHFGR